MKEEWYNPNTYHFAILLNNQLSSYLLVKKDFHIKKIVIISTIMHKKVTNC